jgi:peptidyl-prolyl cis-trans isomerase C
LLKKVAKKQAWLRPSLFKSCFSLVTFFLAKKKVTAQPIIIHAIGEEMLRDTLKLVTVAAALSVALIACGPKGEQKAGEAGAKSASPVLAVVNGTNITADDFKDEASSLSPMAVKALSDEKNKAKFLDNLVDKQLIVQKAESAGLDKDPDVVRRVEQIRKTLLLGMYVKKEVLDKSAVTDQDVKAYFTAHKDELGSVRLSHILVPTQAQAEEVLAKIKAGGDFAKLAKQYSLDTKTKGSGGDLGYVKWEQFGSTGLKDAAFKLKPGETSGIVQSQFGYHIMKVTEKKPAADSDYEAMKPALKEQVAEKKKEELFDSIVKELREKAKITTNAENLKAVSFTQPLQQPGAPAAK